MVVGSVGGTVKYMAPEVLAGVPRKGKMMPQVFSDVWATSLVAVEWYTGKHPWDCSGGELKKEIKKKQRDHQQPEQLNNVPKEVLDVLTAGLSYDHRARPSAERMADIFGQLIG